MALLQMNSLLRQTSIRSISPGHSARIFTSTGLPAAVEEAPPSPVVSVETTQRLTRRQLLIRIGAVVAVILLIAGILVYYRWRLSVQQRRLDATMANFQAFIADSQGRLTEAQSLFIRAIALDPTVARYWRDLGDFYYRQELEGRTKAERMRDAAYYYRNALERDPQDSVTRRRLEEIEDFLAAAEEPQ